MCVFSPWKKKKKSLHVSSSILSLFSVRSLYWSTPLVTTVWKVGSRSSPILASRLLSWQHYKRQNGRGTCFQVTICPAWMVTAPRENPRVDAAQPRPGQAVIVIMSITVYHGTAEVPRPASQICQTTCRPHRTARTAASWTSLRACLERRTTTTLTTTCRRSTWTRATPHLA